MRPRYQYLAITSAVLGTALVGFILFGGTDPSDLNLTIEDRIQLHQKNPVLDQEMVRNRSKILEYSSIVERDRFFQYFVGKQIEFTGKIFSVDEETHLERVDGQLVTKQVYRIFISDWNGGPAYASCHVDRPADKIIWPQEVRKDEKITVAGPLDDGNDNSVNLYPCRLIRREK